MADLVKMRHPKLPGRVRAVQASAFRVWERQGWVKASDDAKVTNDAAVRELVADKPKPSSASSSDTDKGK